MSTPAADPPVSLTRRHLVRLREIYRSSGWPSLDAIEVDLRAAGLLEAERDPSGRETLRLTQAGLVALAHAQERNRQSRSAHETLVEQVAQRMAREGRLAWRGLSLRARLEPSEDGAGGGWVVAMPDVFSVRHTSMEAYLEPVVHEVKASRADLLGDLKKPHKRAAYVAMAQQVYYVLAMDARHWPIAEADEIPPECGVIVASPERWDVLRVAPRHPFERLRFDVWMALARATPCDSDPGDVQPGL